MPAGASERCGAAAPLARRALLLCAAGVAAGCAHRPAPQPPAAARHSVPPFSAAAGPGLPPGWEPYALRRDRGVTDYRLAEHGGRSVLHAHAQAASTAARCAVDIDPNVRPWLQWSWRVDRLVEGARVDVDHRDDAPARVVLAFDGDLGRLSLRDFIFHEQVELFTGKALPYASLFYVWDAELPVGTLVQYPRSSRIKYLVVESGAARLGRWMHYRRDVVADHRRAFGEAPGRVSSVGCFTDSDDLRASAEAWYGDIAFEPASA